MFYDGLPHVKTWGLIEALQFEGKKRLAFSAFPT